MRALVASVCLLVSGTASAALDPMAIAIAPVASPNDMGGMAGIVAHEGAVEAAKQAGVRVVGPDDVEKLLGADGMKRLSSCQGGAACAAVELTPVGAGRALVGGLDRDEVHYIVRLAFIDVGSGKTIAAAERTVLIAGRTLEQEVAAMLPDLLAGKGQVPSKLTITSNARHARATLDDAPLGEVPVTIEVSPGKHELRVEKADYLPTTRFIEVAVSESQTVAVPITLLPNRVDPDASAAEPALAGPPAAAEGSSGSSPIASAVVLGVGVAALAVGIGFGVGAHNIQTQAVDTDGDGALNITRAQALKGQQDATIANVCYVGAGVAALGAVALYFLQPGGSPTTPKAALSPVPGGAMLAFAGSF